MPARNEEAHLWQALQALRTQRLLDGTPMDPRCYEVLLLLNGCSDGSARIALRFQQTYPDLMLRLAQWEFPAAQAHVGSARSLLMAEAARRLSLHRSAAAPYLLLTTDADTMVDSMWLAETVRCVRLGADAVGGNIQIRSADLRDLPQRVRRAYVLDRRYRRAVAALEALLDPLPHDPWPRHQHHFGGSLACTLEAYRNIGGMRPVAELEDLAFYEDLIRSGARFRHEPRDRVYTSSRTKGRVRVGLSQQLDEWTRGGRLRAEATDLLAMKLKVRAHLRNLMSRSMHWRADAAACSEQLGCSAKRVIAAAATADSAEACWQALCGEERLHTQLGRGQRFGSMKRELHNVQQLILRLQNSGAKHPSDTSRAASQQAVATMAG